MSERHAEGLLNWPDMSYIDGRKIFNDGRETNVLHKDISLLDDPVGLSVVMPTMERPLKTINTIRSLARSAMNAHVSMEVIVMDNSFEPGLCEDLERAYSADDIPRFVALRYYYDRTLTFPVARNIGIELASDLATHFASWDSDVYCSPSTLSLLFEYWEDNPDIGACAPPLAAYDSGVTSTPTCESESIGDITKNPNERAKLDMPGRLGDEIGLKRDGAILSTMLRGAYLFRRSFAEKISAIHPEEDLFLRDFIVWSNVPTCMTANEIGEKMAYVIDEHAVSFHDLSKDGASMSKDIPLRVEENLKSLCLLFYRELDQITAHPDNLLTRFNTDAVAKLLSTNESTAKRVVEYLIGVARLIQESKNHDGLIGVNKLVTPLPDSHKHSLYLKNFINGLLAPSVYERIKRIKSYNKDVNPYELRQYHT